MENFILIILSIFLGYFLRKLNIFPANAPDTLNKFVIYISLPAMILYQIPKITISFDLIIPIIVAWMVMTLSAIIILILSKSFNFSKEITGSLLLVGIMGNTSFLGIPIINAYYGQSALPYVIVYDQLGSFLALATFGTFIASYYSSKNTTSFKIIIIKVLTFPPFISLLLALCLINIPYPETLASVFNYLGKTIVPIALFAVGLQLQLKLPKKDLLPFSTALGVKLIISPFLAFTLCFLFFWESDVSIISIMEAGMGPMITAGAVASMAGLAPRLTSSIVGYGILISFITTGILFKVLQ